MIRPKLDGSKEDIVGGGIINKSKGTSTNYTAEGIILRNDVLTLEYQHGKPLLKCIGKKTSHLERMGIHRWDGDFLTIEEALYLAELGSAVVVDQKQGNALAIEQLYALLGQLQISLLKYTVFAHLTRSGYIVRRPAAYLCSLTDQQQQNYPLRVRTFHFEKKLLDQFPSIQTINTPQLYFHFPPIQMQNPTTTIFARDGSDVQLDSADLNERLRGRVLQSLSLHLSCVRRWDKNPWEQYRPRYWPNFHSLRSAENWKVYELRREGLLRNTRTQIRARSNIQQKRGRTEEPDYELFDEIGNAAPLIYRLLIVDDRYTSDHPNFADLQKLASSRSANEQSTTAPLLIATGTPTCFKINQFQLLDNQMLAVPSMGYVEQNQNHSAPSKCE